MRKLITLFILFLGLGIAKAQDEELKFKEEADYKLGMELTKNKQYEKALQTFKKSAEKGNTASMQEIGLRYYYGFYETKKDFNEALFWFKKSAEHENLDGVYMIGVINTALKNYAEAITWYKNASDKGHILATRNLAEVYRKGQGVVKDNTEALVLYQKASEKDDDGRIAYAIAEIHYSGENGVSTNYSEAINWYRKSAEKDYELAMYMLGSIYYDELSKEISDDEAIKWLNKAIAKGNEDASELLTEIVMKNTAEALEDFNKSSN